MDKAYFDAISKDTSNVAADNEIAEKERVKALKKKAILTGHELMSLPSRINDYMVENILWRNQIAIILAKEKVGKSILIKQMSCALTSGTAFLDCYEIPSEFKVLYMQFESDMEETKDRLKRMSCPEGVPVNLDNFFLMYKSGIALNVDSDADKVMEEIDDIELKPDVIFIDPLYTAIKGSLSSDDVCGSLIKNLRRIQNKYDCSIVIGHHEHKPIKNKDGKQIDEGDNSIMGSFALKAFASHVLRITNNIKTNVRTLKCTTQRNGNVINNINLDLIEPDPLMFRIQGIGKASKSTEAVLKLLSSVGKPMAASDVVDATGMNDTTVRHAFGKLKKHKKIEIHQRKGNKVLYKPIGETYDQER